MESLNIELNLEKKEKKKLNCAFIVSLILSFVSISCIIIIVILSVKTQKEINNYSSMLDTYKNKVELLEKNLEKLNSSFTSISLNNETENKKDINELIKRIDRYENKYGEIENELEIINKTNKNSIQVIENNLDNLERNISQCNNKYLQIFYKLDDQPKEIYNTVFPIGAYFITSSETNPAVMFGGKWELVKNRFIVGAGDKYKVNSLGGEEKHQITSDEMPSHSHRTVNRGGLYSFGGEPTSTGPAEGRGYRTYLFEEETSWVGGNKPHNNMPPYISAYLWRRVE